MNIFTEGRLSPRTTGISGRNGNLDGMLMKRILNMRLSSSPPIRVYLPGSRPLEALPNCLDMASHLPDWEVNHTLLPLVSEGVKLAC